MRPFAEICDDKKDDFLEVAAVAAVVVAVADDAGMPLIVVELREVVEHHSPINAN